MADMPIKRGRGSGAGWAPFAAAKRCEIAWPRFQKAIENGEVEIVEFGDLIRITDQEIARIRGLYGLSPTPEKPDEPPIKAEPRKSAGGLPPDQRKNSAVEPAE